MSEVTEFVAEILETQPALAEVFPDQPARMARIEGVIDGQRYAAIVSPALAEDRLAAESYLRMLARDTP